MTDMICRKSMQRCQTPAMCAPYGGCADPSTARGGAAIEAAIATLTAMGYTYNGGQQWKPPVGKKPNFALIDRLKCQLEVSEDTRQVLRKCLAQAESEIDALRAQLVAPQPFKRCTILKDADVTYSTSSQPETRPAGCCCPPPGHTGIWAAAMCPVHQGLRRQVL